MNIKPCIFFLMITGSFCVNAEVFKCQSSVGKTIYQPEPCSHTAKQKVIEVNEMTPEETEQAKAKLRAWQDRQAAEEAVKLAAEQERHKQMEQQQAQDAQQRMQTQQNRQAPPPTGINRRFGYLPN